MITFLALPRRFVGEFDGLQRRAIRSWQQSAPRAQVLLFGDEPGTSRAVQELHATQCKDIAYDAAGRPLCDQVFALGDKYAAHPWLCYCSADVQLDFDAAAVLAALKDVARPFVIGRRWDIAADESKALHAPCGIDYYLYRRHTLGPVLPFTFSGGGGDQWMVWKALTAWEMTVIDATQAINALHHPHSHPEWANGKAGREGSIEQRYNRTLLQKDGMLRPYGVDDAAWTLNATQQIELKGRVAAL